MRILESCISEKAAESAIIKNDYSDVAVLKLHELFGDGEMRLD